jgi:hypothetical protein
MAHRPANAHAMIERLATFATGITNACWQPLRAIELILKFSI